MWQLNLVLSHRPVAGGTMLAGYQVAEHWMRLEMNHYHWLNADVYFEWHYWSLLLSLYVA
jgi:hypothetical protein